ncbi:MAG: DsbA family protein, partial [Blastocatellia bacterium]
LRKNEVDLRINDVLLRQQADKEKATTQSLLDREVKSKTRIVAEADALEYYNKNKQKMPGAYEEVKTSIIQFLQRQEDRKAETAYASDLRKAAKIELFLKPPDTPTFKIATDDQPSKGPDNAPVTVVEFTDYQCPSCAAEEPILERLVREYGGRARLVVRDFPLEQHENAFKAAVAAEAAREQGKYWEYTDLLFHNQSALTVDKLKDYASRIGLDRKKFDADLDSNKFASQVQRDLQEGMKLGIEATPGVFVNGKRMDVKSYESLKSAIDEELKTAAGR